MNFAIQLEGISKSYRIWKDPAARLRAPLLELFARTLPRTSRFRQSVERDGNGAYHPFFALRDVSVQVRRGEAMAIIGRNGSGKSTLLQIIASTLQPTTGTVQTQGRIAALLELGSGFNPEFTGRENVHLNATLLGLSQQQIDARFDQIAAFADIGEFIEQPVKTYSSGMALRLAFAVMAHVDTDILIIDEALSVGDAFFAQKCMRFLRQFRERGTLLFVSHDMASVRGFCDTAIWLERGRVRMYGSAQDVSSQYLAEMNLSQDNKETVAAKPERPAPSTLPPIAPASPAAAVAQPRLVVNNPLVVTPFNPRSEAFGDRHVEIVGVAFLDADSKPLALLCGGSEVRLRITTRARQDCANLIVGFNLKDRLGQYLFGENTYRALQGRTVDLHAGDELHGEFCFQMPVLHRGSYGLIAAVANGSPANHRQQHWMHEALLVESATDWPHAGLLGIPMNQVDLHRVPATGASNAS